MGSQTIQMLKPLVLKSLFKPLIEEKQWIKLGNQSAPQKLKNLKSPILECNSIVFGHIGEKIQKLEMEIRRLYDIDLTEPIQCNLKHWNYNNYFSY